MVNTLSAEGAASAHNMLVGQPTVIKVPANIPLLEKLHLHVCGGIKKLSTGQESNKLSTGQESNSRFQSSSQSEANL